MKETGAGAVKLEGGAEIKESIERIISARDTCNGASWFNTANIHKFGTYAVRAKEEEESARLMEDARLLEKTGCFALVLEKIPANLGAEVSKTVKIPVIGIGAGNGVDGQVLVLLMICWVSILISLPLSAPLSQSEY